MYEKQKDAQHVMPVSLNPDLSHMHMSGVGGWFAEQAPMHG